MTTVTAAALPDDINFLKQLLLEKINAENEKDKLVAQKEKRIHHLEQIVHYLKLKQYGRSSERHTGDSPQEEMFNEAEQCQDASAPDIASTLEAPQDAATTSAAITPTKKRGRRALPENLRREKVYHDLAEQARHCACGCRLNAIDDVISEQLAVIPAELYVIQHCRKKYVCPSCKTNAPITAPLPPQPLPKSNASPELLAHIAVSKFLDGLPFYRQEKIWERLDIHLPRATQANWMIGCGGLAQPLVNLLFDYHGQGDLLFIDETPVQVLKEKDKPPDGNKYFWLAVGGPPDRRVYRYHYHPSRGSAVAMDLLTGFKGTVMSDDWSVYGHACEKLQLTHIACNDHARRKFDKALKDLPKNRKQPGSSRAEMGIHYYKKLYAVERRISTLAVEEKRAVRQRESVPLWDTFIAWMEPQLQQVTPESSLGKALHYTYKLKDKLRYYCEDGALPMSNQVAENAIRPFAIARKNFLFYDTPEGATASANLYSLMMTARHHRLNPFYYLAYVFKMLPLATTVEDIEALLPWRLSDAVTKQNCSYVKAVGD